MAPAGTHVATCIRVIDLGTQKDMWKGREKCLHKVYLGWELPEERAVFDEEKGEEPYLVSKEFTLSLGEKSNLRHFLESWRSRAFSESELAGFDLKKLVGQPCLVTVVHQRKQDGSGVYDKVTGVSKLPKKMEKPKQILEPLFYEIEQGRDQVFELLPDWQKDKILLSEEFVAGPRGNNDSEPDLDEVNEDDIPF